MPNVADVLERESRTVDLEPGDFERLLGRRERKQRNRRIRAGVVGVIMALAAGFILVRALTPHPIPANRPVKPKLKPAPSPAAAGTLAYALDGDIYVADPDGSNPVKIADGRSEADCMGFGAGGEYWAETDDMWSPDGKYLAYRYSGCPSRREDGPKGVVISDAEGNVFAKFPTGMGWQIRWSPNSDRVAVWDDYGKTIGIYGPGGRQTQLTMPPPGGAGGDIDPYWTPDGTSVLVGAGGMIELPLDGGAPRAYRSYWDKDNPPASSPDGSQIAYLERRSVMIANADGSNPRELLGHGVGNPVWSPTGDRIAVATADHGDRSRIELRVLDVATGSVTLVTEAERGSGLEVVGFTPRGDRIFFSTGSEGSWSGWSIGVDGSDARLIVDGTLDGSFARFIVGKLGDNFYRAPWSPGTGTG